MKGTGPICTTHNTRSSRGFHHNRNEKDGVARPGEAKQGNKIKRSIPCRCICKCKPICTHTQCYSQYYFSVISCHLIALLSSVGNVAHASGHNPGHTPRLGREPVLLHKKPPNSKIIDSTRPQQNSERQTDLYGAHPLMVNPVWCTRMPKNDSGDNRWQRCAQMTPQNTVCAGGRGILYGEFSAQGNFCTGNITHLSQKIKGKIPHLLNLECIGKKRILGLPFPLKKQNTAKQPAIILQTSAHEIIRKTPAELTTNNNHCSLTF